MGLFRRNDKNAVAKRMLETKLFEYVMHEINSDERKEGTWGQALTKTEGEEKKAKALYIKLRVEALKDEIAMNSIIEDEQLRAIQLLNIEETEKVEKESFAVSFGKALLKLFRAVLTVSILILFCVAVYSFIQSRA